MTGDIRISVDEDILDLAEGFIDHRRDDVRRLREALAAEDWAALRLMGHELKGTAGSYGFAELSRLGRRLETAALSQDLGLASDAVRELHAYLARVRVLPR